MNLIPLSETELQNTYVGEIFTVAAIMTILCTAVMAVVVYKLFFSTKGSAAIPGGWKFTWGK